MVEFAVFHRTLENIWLGSLIVVGIPLLTLTFLFLCRTFRVRADWRKALGAIAGLVIVDLILTYLIESIVFDFLVGLIIYTVVAAVLFRKLFDLTWKSAVIITFIWFVIQQILFAMLSFIMPIFVAPIVFGYP